MFGVGKKLSKKSSMRKEVNTLELKGFKVKKLSNTKNPPKTQKAKGVWALLNGNPFKFLTPAPAFVVLNTDDEMEGREGWPYREDQKVFGRPCPPDARHGYVDSREVKDMDAAKALFMGTLDVNQHSELLLMEFIDAEFSAIWVPESGAWILGPGHDGATAGKDSITLPVITSVVDEAFKDRAGIVGTNHTYVELVYPKYQKKAFAVQARSGPPIPCGVSDYIPERMKVESVLEPSNDLIAHEQLCIALAGAPGVVFWQKGGSLGAHPAVHCALNKIAYVTGDTPPAIGSWIEPRVPEVAFSLSEFHRGIRATERVKGVGKKDVADNLKLAIALIHNIPTLMYSPAYSRLLGFAVGWIFRAAAIACLGESRHYIGTSHGKSGALGTTDRHLVYERAGDLPNSELCSRLARFSYKFNHVSWSSGYGGWKWYSALVKAIKLWNYVSVARHAEAAVEANVLLNMAHNGGWLFNKFCDQQSMTNTAMQPAQAMLEHASAIWNIFQFNDEIQPIMPRTYRASSRWKLAVVNHKPGTQIKTHKKIMLPAAPTTLVLKINRVQWHALPMNEEHMEVITDMFEHV